MEPFNRNHSFTWDKMGHAALMESRRLYFGGRKLVKQRLRHVSRLFVVRFRDSMVECSAILPARLALW